MRLILSALLAATVIAPSASRAQQVNTTTAAPSNNWIDAPVFTTTAGQSYGFGQVFTVPTATTFLESFSVWGRQVQTWGNSEFRAHLATWDDGSTSFSDIWAGPARNITSPAAPLGSTGEVLANWAEQMFTPGLGLNAGATYLAYVEVSQALDFANSASGDGFAARFVSADGNTGLVRLDNGAVGQVWDNADMAFTATFSPVPEPSSLILLGTGLLMLLGMGKVRSRREA